MSTLGDNLIFNKGGKMTKSKKTYHHGDLRNSLVLAAEQLLEEKGVGAVSLRQVAKVAGVSHSAPYRHFADKNALLAGLAVVGFGRLADEMERCVTEQPEDPVKQLAASAEAYVALAISHPQMTNLMFGGVLKKLCYEGALDEESERAFNGLVKIIQNGQQAGLYIEKESQELALFAWSQAHGFSMLITAGQLGELSDDKKAIEAMVSSMGEMIMNGIGK